MTVDKIKISIAMSCSPKGDCGIGLRSKYAKVQRRNRRHSIINIHVNNELRICFTISPFCSAGFNQWSIEQVLSKVHGRSIAGNAKPWIYFCLQSLYMYTPPLILQRRHTVVTCGICIKRYPVMACHNWDCSDLNRCSPGIMGVTL